MRVRNTGRLPRANTYGGVPSGGITYLPYYRPIECLESNNNYFPGTESIGEGYDVDVNEFDFRDDNWICYDEDAVTIWHWRRSHTKDGASAYRLDWNDDGRPDELTAKYAKGCDVYAAELSAGDTGKLSELKYGLPATITNYTLDTHHTHEYAAG